ncbi:MAG: YdcF family protein [Halioglobus sp.]
MSFFVSKLLSLLVYPLSMSLIVAIVGLLLVWCRRPRLGAGLLSVAIAWLYLCSTALFADFLMGELELGYTPRALSVLEKADAIVLLGGGTRGYTHMGRLADLNQHADRLVHAAELYKADKAPVILLSGGAPRGDKHEAGQMRDVLRVMGVPAKAMLLETQSRNTAENAQFSGQLLRDRDLQRVLLVTSAFHMRRAERLFRAEGLQVIPAPRIFSAWW